MRLSALLLAFTLGLGVLMSRPAVAQDAPAPAAKGKPNFLFVFIDDMGSRDLSCFGGARVKTAEIDRLAAEGVRFNQFYVNSPICSPSRVAVTTGQYPGRWNVTSFLSGRSHDAERGMADWLSLEAPTLARELKKAGYRTAHVGKWHMGGQRDVADAPHITEYGFDTSITNFEGLGDRILAKFAPKPDGSRFNHGPTDTSAKFGGPGVQWEDRTEVSARFVDRAIEEMKTAQAEGKPFYINLWPDDVHSPVQAKPELAGDGSPAAHYLGVLKELDRQLGRAFEFVRADPALRDNTIILLASDNGHENGLGTAGEMRGSKGTLFEGGIRSPLIVWAPGRQPAAARGSMNEKTLLAGFDLPPSLLAIAGVKADGVAFDGKDMSEALLGKSQPARDGLLFFSRPPDRPGPKGSLPDLAVRDGRWKLLVDRDGSNAELYDILADETESKNLAADHPDRVKKLTAAAIEWDKHITRDAAANKQQVTSAGN